MAKRKLFDRLLWIMWWALPVFFGILGGAISYIAVGMAQGKQKEGKYMLIIGLAVTIISAILYTLGIVSILSIVLTFFKIF
jgi:heme/copper-type cytochrome/quinol oxidase subunit 2